MLREEQPRKAGHEIAEATVGRRRIRFIAHRVVVKLAPVEGEAALRDAVASILAEADGAAIVREPSPTGRVVLRIPEGTDVLQYAKRLAESPLVEYAEPDVVDTAQLVPADPRYPQQWAPPLVNAEEAWDLTTGGPGVVIGVIDSGISMTGAGLDHDDLSTPGRFTLGTDFVDGGTPRDLNGHGTHVAGIAAARGGNGAGIAGMNWASPVYICRTLDANGNGSGADFADAVEEITDYAVAHNVHAVINYSGGGAHSQAKQDACQYASDHGMLVVAATGNDNGGPVISPAHYSTTIVGVIGVGSTDADDTVSSFSNVGPEVTVVAPGRNIISTTPTYVVDPAIPVNYGWLSGTSMATPLVTGLAALMWSRHTSHSNQKVKQCLTNTAVKLGSGSFDNSWGHGRVDAEAAVKCGDLVIPITVIGPACGGLKTKLIADCLPKSALCPSKLARCQSRLPVLCPTTRLQRCWSRLLCLEPVSELTVCVPKTIVGPSAVDACPSAPGGCPWIPFDPAVDPARFPAGDVGRLPAPGPERWSAEEMPAAGEGGWFYVDDAGDVHEV